MSPRIAVLALIFAPLLSFAQAKDSDSVYLENLSRFINKASNDSFAMVHSLPKVVRMNLPDLQSYSHYSGENAKGAYLPARGVDQQIALLDTLDLQSNLCDRSVLLHELVHFFQYQKIALEEPNRYSQIIDGKGGMSADGVAENERQAYFIQYKYLKSYPSHVEVNYTLNGRLNCKPL